MRFRTPESRLDERVAGDLTATLHEHPAVSQAAASALTGSVLIHFDPSHRDAVHAALESYEFDETRALMRAEQPETQRGSGALQESGGRHRHALGPSGSSSSAIIRLVAYYLLRPLLPPFVRMAMAIYRSLPFLSAGLRALWRRRLNINVLDAFAIGLSLARGDFRTVGNIISMFALSDALEHWTREKSRASLAASLAVDVDSVWVRRGDAEHLVPLLELEEGEIVVVRSGSSIPVDGVVVDGDASVNEASMTGEGIAVARSVGASVYAGTVVEDGQLGIRATGVGPKTRVNEIIRFIEESESRKSVLESKAEALAERIVPYSFLLSALVLLFTRSLSRAASVLLVDYSCAIRLATPLAVLTAMREGAGRGVLIKGGRYLEALAAADVIVFDKTGTLTMARPSVAQVVPLNGYSRDDVLRIAACLEEHFPHPVARAVVRAAKNEGLDHHEEHTEVEYVVAHGVASRLRGQRVLIGSSHFVHDDQNVPIGEEQNRIDEWADRGYSILHLAVDGRLVGILCIEDPPRPEAPAVISKLRTLGVKRILMLTGDASRTAEAVAETVGIGEWRAGVLPVDKAEIVRELQAQGHTVLMVGDGINDSPALSAADVGVSMRDGADLAREVADVVLAGNDLSELVFARRLARASLARVRHGFGAIVGLNTGYLGLGLTGRAQPSSLALLHNLTTVGVSLNSMRPMLEASTPDRQE